jgi:DNA-directed RNA polymerase II subunit RPB2
MNIQMRIITEDNIDQLTSMNYAKTIENLKLTQLTEKEEEFVKKYEKPILDVEKERSTEKIVEDTKIKDLKDVEQELTSKKLEDEENDEEGLSQVTRDSIRRAEEEFEKYEELEDSDEEEDKQPIDIGDKVDEDELGIQDLGSQEKKEPNEKSGSEKSVKIAESKNEVVGEDASDELEVEELPNEKSDKKEPALLEVDTETLEDESKTDSDGADNSAKRKTIKIEGQ